MKIKPLSRNPDNYVRETKESVHKVFRNYDPLIHPFQVQREYTSALNATKLERVFAKPFVACLDGHKDGISTLAVHPSQLSTIVSGSYDGEIRLWNISNKKCISRSQAHNGHVKGLSFNVEGTRLYSCGDDNVIKCWQTQDGVWEDSFLDQELYKISSKSQFLSIDHCRDGKTFLTSGDAIEIWQDDRTVPTNKIQWGCDSINCARFNPTELNLVASVCSDKSITLYDVRESSPMKKVVLNMCSNSVCWNTMNPSVLTVANDDYNLYTFDIRNLNKARNVHKDHISAVMDIDYSPTGTEFVSAGYDKCIRIFNVNQGHSRDIYTTKRMQRVVCCKWSLDNNYLISGSDETNVRVWKSNASQKLGTLHYREKNHLNYCNKVKEKFQHHPQIKRISRHRHVPNFIYQARQQMRESHNADEKKEKHSSFKKPLRQNDREKPIQKIVD